VSWLERFALAPAQASTLAPRVDALFGVLTGLTIALTIGIALAIAYCMVRFRRRPYDDPPVGVHGSYWLEIGWSW
jgi:cytochrome c oxidase subunit 2